MINYVLELSAIHLILMLGYFIFLRNERQHHVVRCYLLASVILSLVIPLLKLPRILHGDETTQLVAGGVGAAGTVTVPPVAHPSFWSVDMLWMISIGVSFFFLLKFLINLRHLIRLKQSSRCESSDGYLICYNANAKGSFSFFRWIFMNEEMAMEKDSLDVMLTHERAHARMGHTYDLILFELFRMCFWWLPSAWYVSSEIKKTHEYQADASVLEQYSPDEYSSVLIGATLKINGMGPVSSFYDGSILKRVMVMNTETKRVRPWKLGALMTLGTAIVVAFACTEDKEPNTLADPTEEVFTIVEKAPEFKGGMPAFNHYILNEIKYPQEARKRGLEGKLDLQFVIDKDGALTDITASQVIGGGCEQEAARVLRSAPAFTPAEQQGKPVRVRMSIPIVFKLDKLDPTNPNGVIIAGPLQAMNAKLKVNASYNNGKWTGTIADDQGEKLPGANIIIEGTTNGTTSDLNGAFTIEAAQTDDLVLSFIGYDMARLEGNN